MTSRSRAKTNNTVGIYTNSDGTLTSIAQVTVPEQPVAMVSGGFDGNGQTQIAVLMDNGGGNTGEIQMLARNDDGFWATSGNPIAVGVDPTAIATADFNNDGRPDLVVATAGDAPTVSGAIEILLANGDGTFTETTQSPIADSGTPEALATGDFGSGAGSSIAIANDAGTITTLLLGQGNGTFTAGPTTTTGDVDPTALVAADFNGDRQIDLAENDESHHKVGVWLGSGSGTFTLDAGTEINTQQDVTSLAVGDFNGDKHPDLVYTIWNGVWDRPAASRLAGKVMFGQQRQRHVYECAAAVLRDRTGSGRDRRWPMSTATGCLMCWSPTVAATARPIPAA